MPEIQILENCVKPVEYYLGAPAGSSQHETRAIRKRALARSVLTVGCLLILATIVCSPTQATTEEQSNKAREYAMTAWRLADAGRGDEALSLSAKAMQLDPNDVLSLRVRYMVFCSRKSWLEAVKCMDKALSIKPENGDFLLCRARALTGSRRFSEAQEDLSRLIKLNKEVIASHSQRVGRDRLVGEMEMSKYYGTARSERAVVATQLKHWQIVIEDCTWLIDNDERQIHPRLEQRGAAYIALKQYDKALADYKHLVKDWPTDGDAHLRLLKLSETMGDERLAAAERKNLQALHVNFRSNGDHSSN